MNPNRISYGAARAICAAAAGLPGGAHAFKAYATAAVAQLELR